MKKELTKYTLQKASEHIFYEVWMFYQTLTFLRKAQNLIERNILLDAFAVHTRNLFDFFYPKAKLKADDIIVSDYLPNLKNFNLKKTKKKNLLFIVRKTDKQVAHLTYARNRYNQKTKSWPFVDIGIKMYKTIDAFYSALPELYKKWRYMIELEKIINLYRESCT